MEDEGANDEGLVQLRLEITALLETHCVEQVREIVFAEEAAVHYSLVLNWREIHQENMRLTTLLQENPQVVLDQFDAALKELQLKHISRLRQRYSLPAEDAAFGAGGQAESASVPPSILEDIQASPFFSGSQLQTPHIQPHLPPERATYKPKVHVRISNMSSPGYYRVRLPRSDMVGSMVTVRGTVIRTGTPQMLEYSRLVQCTRCKHRFRIEADIEEYFRFPKLPQCPSKEGAGGKACPSKVFQPVEGSAKCRDYQEIKVQEQIQSLGVGNIPRSVLAILEDDLVDACRAGDDILLTGIVYQRWKALREDERCHIDIVFRANYLQILNDQESSLPNFVEITSDIQQFWNYHQDNPLTGRDHILKSVCPQLFGLATVKLALLLVLIGGVPSAPGDLLKLRGESHLLLVGDPGTGKSQMLKFASKLIPRSVLTTGVGTTSAGLTVYAARDDTGGNWVLEPGALVLADGGVCCIDEFNSISPHDRTTIHEAMEQQTLSVAKVGMVCTLRTRCSVIAATNPKGQYDVNESISVNCALGTPLLSRFDLIFILTDQSVPDWDDMVASFILSSKIEPTEAAGAPNASPSSSPPPPGPFSSSTRDDDEDVIVIDPFSTSPVWSFETLQSYVMLVKQMFQPKLSQPAKMLLSRYFQLQRKADTSGVNAARTSMRLLESLIRLAQAHARLMWRDIVDLQDAIMAIFLTEASIYGSAVLPDANLEIWDPSPSDPQTKYLEFRDAILSHLQLEHLLVEVPSSQTLSDPRAPPPFPSSSSSSASQYTLQAPRNPTFSQRHQSYTSSVPQSSSQSQVESQQSQDQSQPRPRNEDVSTPRSIEDYFRFSQPPSRSEASPTTAQQPEVVDDISNPSPADPMFDPFQEDFDSVQQFQVPPSSQHFHNNARSRFFDD